MDIIEKMSFANINKYSHPAYLC